jgi:hypothetical protein
MKLPIIVSAVSIENDARSVVALTATEYLDYKKDLEMKPVATKSRISTSKQTHANNTTSDNNCKMNLRDRKPIHYGSSEEDKGDTSELYEPTEDLVNSKPQRGGSGKSKSKGGESAKAKQNRLVNQFRQVLDEALGHVTVKDEKRGSASGKRDREDTSDAGSVKISKFHSASFTTERKLELLRAKLQIEEERHRREVEEEEMENHKRNIKNIEEQMQRVIDDELAGLDKS